MKNLETAVVNVLNQGGMICSRNKKGKPKQKN